MVLKLITGRLGTGKTKELLKQVDRNNENLFITTDPSVMYIEKYMAKNKIPCTTIGVSSFPKFILNTLNIKYGEILDKNSQLMLISKIVADNKEELNLLNNVNFDNGTINHIHSFIKECKEKNITPKEIAVVEEKSNGLLLEKMHDISIIFEKFNQELESRNLTTPEDIMKIALDALMEVDAFPITNIMIDSLDNYNQNLLELIYALMDVVENIAMSFKTTSPKAYDYEICKNGMDTHVEIRNYAENSNNISVEPITLKQESKADNGIRIIEKELFNRDTNTVSKSDNVALIEAESPMKEVELVTAKIKEMITSNQYKPEDITVTASNISEYIQTIKYAFKKNNLQYFYYKDNNLSETNLCGYIDALIAVVKDRNNADLLLELLKYEFYNVPKKTLDVIDEFFVRFGDNIQMAISNGEEYDKVNAEIVKATIYPVLKNVNVLTDELMNSYKAKDYIEAIYNYLEVVKINEFLMNRYMKLNSFGKLQEAENIKSIWTGFTKTMEQIHKIMDEKIISFPAFLTIYKKAIEEYNISISQQYYGQISIMDMNQAQYKKSKVSFVLGCNEGKFPTPNSIPFISDYEKKIIELEIGKELSNSNDKAIEKLSVIYNVITLPIEKICLSWSLNDFSSKKIRPASLLNNVIKTFQENIIKEQAVDVNKEEQFYQLLFDISEYRKTGKEPKDLAKRYQEFNQDKKYSERLFNAISNVLEEKARINSDRVLDAYNEKDFMSATRLEKFNSCPFKHFIDHGLKPNRIKMFDETAADKGNFYHYVMKEIFDKIKQDGIDISVISKEQLFELADPIIEKVAEKHNENIFQTIDEYKYQAEKLKEAVKVSAWEAVKQLNKGTFHVEKGEYIVGKQIPLQITTPSGKVINLSGTIDRIDVSQSEGCTQARIIDYKSGSTSFSEELLDAGVQLQLPLYAMAVSGEYKLTGVYYMKITNPILDADNKEDSKEKVFTLSGPTKQDIVSLLANDKLLAECSYESDVIKVSTTTKGELSKKSKVLTAEEFQGFMDKGIQIASETAERILNGETIAKPFINKTTNSCEYCKYHSLCQR